MEPPIKSILRPILSTLFLALLMVGILPVWSSGASPADDAGGLSMQDPVPEDNPPFILSENPYNRMLRLWGPPSSNVVILYDQWNIFLFGQPNQTWRIVINEVLVKNGTISGTWTNTTLNAISIDRARVNVTVGGKTWTWWNVVVNHREIGYNGPGSLLETNPYDEHDLNWAKLKTAAGVLLCTVALIPAVWWMVKQWRLRQGVRQW